MSDLNIRLSDNDYSDEARAEFIKDLDDADHIDLSDFEMEFVESNISRREFTPAATRRD
jgi:hypothetical protein